MNEVAVICEMYPDAYWPLENTIANHAFDLSAIRWDLKIPVKSYAIMFINDRHSPNRDFAFPILFDDTGNW